VPLGVPYQQIDFIARLLGRRGLVLSMLKPGSHFGRTPLEKRKRTAVREELITIFLVFVSVIVAGVTVRSAYRNTSEWFEDSRERIRHKRLAVRLLGLMQGKPRQELVEIALAIALSPHNWPDRKAGNDESMSRARKRYLSSLEPLADEDLKLWIEDQVREKHFLHLQVALESLNEDPHTGV
jgi:hypothetical protein